MNNEEKILQVLGEMQAEIASLRKETNERFNTVDKRFDKVDKKLEDLETSVNYAAKDSLSHIRRHEREFHNVG